MWTNTENACRGRGHMRGHAGMDQALQGNVEDLDLRRATLQVEQKVPPRHTHTHERGRESARAREREQTVKP